MIVHGVAFSPYVLKVLVFLEEKGIAYTVAPPAPELHPLGKMPVLRDGGIVVPDSSAICAYLERKHPKPALFPDTPAELAQAIFLEEYGDARMAEGMGEIVLEKIVKPQMLGQPTDEERLANLLVAARERWMGSPRSAAGHPVASILDHLEAQIPADRASILSRFGLADIAVVAHMGWLDAAGLEIDRARWPRVARHVESVSARPSFVRARAH